MCVTTVGRHRILRRPSRHPAPFSQQIQLTGEYNTLPDNKNSSSGVPIELSIALTGTDTPSTTRAFCTFSQIHSTFLLMYRHKLGPTSGPCRHGLVRPLIPPAHNPCSKGSVTRLPATTMETLTVATGHREPQVAYNPDVVRSAGTYVIHDKKRD